MFKDMNEIESFMKSRDKLGIQPGLDRMRTLLKRIGHPEKKLIAIHVAGTNGKGSTIHYLSHALMNSGYHVGVFTSPSMTNLRGHILLDDTSISEKEFIGIMNMLYPHIMAMDKADMGPSTFEIITAAAFSYFSLRADISLIETGMGGKDDTTNVITPIISVITTVAIDHQQFLGQTIQEIAEHKAGIIKHRVPIVVGELDDESLYVVEKFAKLNNAPLYRLGKEFCYTYHVWSYQTCLLQMKILMKGRHQKNNAAIALMVLYLFKKQKRNINLSQAVQAIENVIIPGRYEQICSTPSIIIDGAHNPNGMEVFLQTMWQNKKHRINHLIFAGFKDKALATMLKMAEPFFDTITLTTFAHERAISVTELGNLCHHPNVHLESDWKRLINHLLTQETIDTDEGYFVVGSFHFISLVRQFIKDVEM